MGVPGQQKPAHLARSLSRQVATRRLFGGRAKPITRFFWYSYTGVISKCQARLAPGHADTKGNELYDVVETVEATRELRGLVETGLVEMHGTRRWAYYTLSEATPRQVQLALPEAMSDEEKVLAYVREHGSITNAQCRYLLGWAEQDRHRAKRLLVRLVNKSKLRPTGKGRWIRYEQNRS